ncbi:hypothetical protein V495_05572 [Pseudogymnoascus sp. VKM F-4514 (FW-929)]|nr:hypothetical protein V495_05572 [Pseudogymnoascus sp. VKM F-4514 (FW-929)]KFY55092.1 hypothetical protein V497_07207 [Pseudogymnoascus sp. VKM F-4516 (FW-969)]
MAASAHPEKAIMLKACEDDDTTLLEEAISMTAKEDLQAFYNDIRREATRNSAIAILNSLIERGASVIPQWPFDARGSSKETLELLLAQGWDINSQGVSPNDKEPFMWKVVRDYDIVEWCLEHGASVHPRGQEPYRDGATTKARGECSQILEVVAGWGSIATFELLRSKGAPLGWRPLHLAVETATYGRPEEAQDFVNHGERMAMVRHLLDVVGLNVNAPDQPVGTKVLPKHLGTPICYIPGSASLERDTQELTWLLLDRGADPTPALEIAKREYPKFTEEVKAWKGKHACDSKCCVQ